MKLIQAINAVNSNILMLCVLFAGIWLTIHGHEVAGGNLVIGSFAVIRSTATPTATPTAPTAPTAPTIPNEQK